MVVQITERDYVDAVDASLSVCLNCGHQATDTQTLDHVDCPECGEDLFMAIDDALKHGGVVFLDQEDDDDGEDHRLPGGCA